MYSVNNVFPNVGFADTYLSDGDIVRVQFTLGYGADIGGFGAMGTSIPNVENQPKSGYFSVANKDSLTKAIERTIYSGLITRSNVKMHTPRHYPLPRRLTLRKARSITRFPLSIRHFKSGVGNKLRSCGCSFVRRRQRRSCVLRCGIRRQECVGRRGSFRFRWVCRRCRGFGCGGIRFSETDAGTEEITETSEALSESEESTENAVSLSENKKSKTLVTVICLVSAFIVLAGGVCFIVFYVKKRRKNGEKEKSVKESSSQK